MEGNDVILGTHGKLWLNGEEKGNVKSFEAKLTANYEDVQIAGELGTDAKYTGYTIEGTMVFHKVDSGIPKMISEGFRTGKLPEISVVAGTLDPGSKGQEKVQLLGVKFNELTLHKFENGTIGEEEVPFRAKTYKYLNTI